MTRNLHILTLLFAAGAVMGFASHSSAAILVEYNFEANVSPSQDSGGAGTAFVSSGVSNFGRNTAGLTAGDGGVGTFGLAADGWGATGDGAPSAAEYLQFTFDPDAAGVNLSTITFSYRGEIASGGGRLETWVDIGGGGFVKVGDVGNSVVGTFSPQTYALTDEVGEVTTSVITVQFRGAMPNTARFLAIDSVRLNGDVIPEPASMALLALGAMLILPRARKGDRA